MFVVVHGRGELVLADFRELEQNALYNVGLIGLTVKVYVELNRGLA